MGSIIALATVPTVLSLGTCTCLKSSIRIIPQIDTSRVTPAPPLDEIIGV